MYRKLNRLLFALIFMIWTSVVYGASLTLGSWNLQWLDGGISSKGPVRTATDLKQLHRLFQRTQIDILAFAEVGDLPTLERVVGHDYVQEISHRYHYPHQGQWPQYTGFAIRRGIAYQRHPDLNLDVHHNHHLRSAVDITFTHIGQNGLRVLAVHLKSGCFSQRKGSSYSCRTLALQAQRLYQWIKQRQHEQQPFVIMGDFNRRLLNVRHRWFWHQLTGHQVALSIANQGRSKCWAKVHPRARQTFVIQHRQYIDFILLSPLARKLIVHDSFREYRPTKRQVQRYQLSDHCPIAIDVTE